MTRTPAPANEALPQRPRAARGSPKRRRQSGHSRSRSSTTSPRFVASGCQRSSSTSGGWPAAPAAAARTRPPTRRFELVAGCAGDVAPELDTDTGFASAEPGLRASRAQGAWLRRSAPSPPGPAFAHPGPSQAARRGTWAHDARALPSRSRPSPPKRRPRLGRRLAARWRPPASCSPATTSTAPTAPPMPWSALALAPRPQAERPLPVDQGQWGVARRSRQGREAAPQARTLDVIEHGATLDLVDGLHAPHAGEMGPGSSSITSGGAPRGGWAVVVACLKLKAAHPS